MSCPSFFSVDKTSHELNDTHRSYNRTLVENSIKNDDDKSFRINGACSTV